ncbi:acylphosphatase [Pseudomonas duriflava]|uniref:acylphosphatase n=1 Tax=Pseudomonas duriflava TaxID=459528 RepID=A0A562QPA6_9PSED|nr:acylphosphatase [Pseudomonas duriflava]TWI58591.1 acylphosphatase [Pseudomonas duriflava]
MRREAWHIHISGRVQGVSYRESARRKAEQLNVTGWVRNLTDGRVELLAEGEPEALEAFKAWLRQGPEHASVVKFEKESCLLEGAMDFRIR